jgi:hypothetical protein
MGTASATSSWLVSTHRSSGRTGTSEPPVAVRFATAQIEVGQSAIASLIDARVVGVDEWAKRKARVPLTVRLATALRDHRHLRSARVLCRQDGSGLSADVVKHHVERAARRAQIAESGVHRLQHSFCSHLAMRGAPARAIQELAGHKDLSTTQRYMHLSPAALEGAIRLLDHQGPAVGPYGGTESSRETKAGLENFGDILETAGGGSAISDI